MSSASQRGADILTGLARIRSWQAGLYRDLHQHPELSHQEHCTAGLVETRLRADGYDVRGRAMVDRHPAVAD